MVLGDGGVDGASSSQWIVQVVVTTVVVRVITRLLTPPLSGVAPPGDSGSSVCFIGRSFESRQRPQRKADDLAARGGIQLALGIQGHMGNIDPQV